MLAHDLIVWTQALAPRRRARQGRAQAAALPAAARRWPARVLRPPREAPPPGHLAVGGRAPRRVPETQNAPSRDRLTPAASDPPPPSRPPGHPAAITAAPKRGRAHATRSRGTRHTTTPTHPDRRLNTATDPSRSHAQSLSRAYCTFRASAKREPPYSSSARTHRHNHVRHSARSPRSGRSSSYHAANAALLVSREGCRTKGVPSGSVTQFWYAAEFH